MMLSHLPLAFVYLGTTWVTEHHNPLYTLPLPVDYGNESDEGSTRNIVVGAIVGGMTLIALTYLIVFVYLRRHGKTFDDLLRRRRDIVDNPLYRDYNRSNNRASDPTHPSFQQPDSSSYDTYAAEENRIPRIPEPAHMKNNQRPQGFSSPSV
ncbi:hypothetical protein B0J17DRAFT_646629 [Rhizoctonia solani]|nr:hypothetical protein B0J17DRAFT_646629 [Rhizoctonia solani]